MKLFRVIAIGLASVVVAGCATTQQEQTYIQSPLYEGKAPKYVLSIEDELLKANPTVEDVDIHVLPGDIYQAFTLRYYGPTGPNKIFIYQGFLDANKNTPEVVAAVIAHEYGHTVHKHNDVHHKGWNTPDWKQHEADDTGMLMLKRANYDPCVMWKIAPDNLERKERILNTCEENE